MLEDAVAVAAVDEVHAAVRDVDVVERHPAGDAALVEVATPVRLVLMPARRRALARRLREELVVPELDGPAEQRRAELDRPGAEARLVDLRPDQRRARLEDLEVALGERLALLPRPVERQLLLVLEDLLAARDQRPEVRRVDHVRHRDPAVRLEELDLLRRGRRIPHRVFPCLGPPSGGTVRGVEIVFNTLARDGRREDP
jgi:hypothetical protein